VRGLSCAAIDCACSSAPPLARYAVIPVARNEWLPIGAMMPAASASLRTNAPGVDLGHRLIGERSAAVPAAGAEQKRFLVGRDAAGGEVGVQRLGEGVVARHHVLPLFQEPPSKRSFTTWAATHAADKLRASLSELQLIAAGKCSARR
jgi:hypothetical protein